MIILSIVIATKDRQEVLLESLKVAKELMLKYQFFEIVIVNDGEEVTLGDINDERIRVFENDGKGVSHARNLGASVAKGHVLFFMDDDMYLTEHFLQWFLKQDETIINSVYNINWHFPDDLVRKMKENKIGRYLLESNYHTMWGRMGYLSGEPTSGAVQVNGVGSGSLLIGKQCLLKIGGYSTKFVFQGEDIEFSQRLNSNNISIFALFDTLVKHNQSDRLEIDAYLQRIYNGAISEFGDDRVLNEKLTQIKSSIHIIFYRNQWIEILIKRIYNTIPNSLLFDYMIFKLLGILSVLQHHKAIKNLEKKKQT